MKIGNEMEIFITLKNTILASGVKKVSAASGDYLVSIFFPLLTIVQHIYEEWDIPINVHT